MSLLLRVSSKVNRGFQPKSFEGSNSLPQCPIGTRSIPLLPKDVLCLYGRRLWEDDHLPFCL